MAASGWVDDGVTTISSAVPLIWDTVAARVRVPRGRGIRVDVTDPAVQARATVSGDPELAGSLLEALAITP